MAAASVALLAAGVACSSGNNGYSAKTAPPAAVATQLAATQPTATAAPTVATGSPSLSVAAVTPTAAVAVGTPLATSQAATPATASSAPVQMAVTISGFAFAPATLRVPVGATVAWSNKDAVTHTVTPDAGGIDDHQLAPGSGFSQTFTNPGTYSYHCSIHPFMKGTIVVG